MTHPALVSRPILRAKDRPWRLQVAIAVVGLNRRGMELKGKPNTRRKGECPVESVSGASVVDYSPLSMLLPWTNVTNG